jgi:hypothetical protein
MKPAASSARDLQVPNAARASTTTAGRVHPAETANAAANVNTPTIHRAATITGRTITA